MKSKALRSMMFGLPLAILMASPAAFAETFSGKLNGFDCVSHGETCPVSRLDPHILLEKDFVLQKADGEYMFLANIPRDTKVRYVLRNIRVDGKLNKKRQSIVVDKFMIKREGKWKTVWSKEAYDEELRSIYESG